MKSKLRVLFVCTGNIFRSVSAEYCLNKYLNDNNINNMIVCSAGTVADAEHNHPTVISTLKSLGIDSRKHQQTKLTKEVLDKYDIIIAMADYHQKFIQEQFGVSVPLFNELAIGEKTSVWDIQDVVSDWENNPKDCDEHIRKTITYINKIIPKIFSALKIRFSQYF